MARQQYEPWHRPLEPCCWAGAGASGGPAAEPVKGCVGALLLGGWRVCRGLGGRRTTWVCICVALCSD